MITDFDDKVLSLIAIKHPHPHYQQNIINRYHHHRIITVIAAAQVSLP